MRRPIVRLGHPALRSSARPVDTEKLKRGELTDLIADLREALSDTTAPTLTAPQLGVELQVLAFREEQAVEGEEDRGARVVVNPMLEPEHGDLVHDWEDCLSIPDLRGLVPRYPVVRLRGVDEQGQPVDIAAEGRLARTLQHAHDHLCGVVFLDRMRDLRSLAFGREWDRYLSESWREAEEEDPREE